MKRTKIFVAAISLLAAGVINAQEAETFTPSGKVTADVFSNYTAEIIGGEVQSVGINLDRAYLGYKYDMSENISTEVKLDIGSESSLSATRVAFFKTACATYKLSSTKIKFGLIGLNQFGLQDKAWGHRYIYKSFQDKHKFGNSADLGIYIEQKVSDDLSIDLTIANGEGYKHIQGDLDFLYAFGATFKPTSDVTFRVYGDFNSMSGTPSTISSFLSIKASDDLSFAGEYNYKINFKGVENNDLAGISLYSTYNVDEKVSLYARYDKIWSNVLEGENDPWNNSKDGNAVIGGLQYMPVKNFKIAFNYTGWIYNDAANDTENIIGIYTEFKF